MDILVTYDVSTEDKAGRRRLRKVAAICKDYGQRVQFSVFECRVTDAQFEAFRAKLVKAIDSASDSLRLYRLPQPREDAVESYGIDRYVDFDEPLIL
ncbi:MAG: CRISPR-associated endonuclease Cas2 [Cyanobacteria bacterium P01_E01_bin.48]